MTGVSLVRDGEESRFAARDPLYFEEDVIFENSGVKLAGSLSLPEGEGPHPAIVLLHGSGPLTRYSFGPYPHFFSSLGFAVLIYDKRGTGESTGLRLDAPFGHDAVERVLTINPQMSDVKTIVDRLSPEVDGQDL